jgi:uncharacterized protein YbaR (Trm112 family)
MTTYICPGAHGIALETERHSTIHCPVCRTPLIVDDSDEEEKQLANDKAASFIDTDYVLKPGIYAARRKIKKTDEFSFLTG